MSNYLYPSLRGESWPVTREWMNSTNIHPANSGAEVRIGRWSYPLCRWTIPYDYLSNVDTELGWQAISGLNAAVHGALDTFLYDDLEDNLAVGTQFGVGDGVTTAFQIGRTNNHGFTPIYNVKGVVTTVPSISSPPARTIYVNGSAVSATIGIAFRPRRWKVRM